MSERHYGDAAVAGLAFAASGVSSLFQRRTARGSMTARVRLDATMRLDTVFVVRALPRS
ncbi:hypothetical protein ACFV0R_06965 [Streptomyces sp. NPDC059578]